MALLGCLEACEVCGGDPYKKSEHEAALALVPIASATTTAVRSGSWSDPAMWSAGIPSAGARVVIPRFMEVTYDLVSGTRLRWIRVDGVMRFATQQSTALSLETLVVTPEGRYEHGTALHPLPAQFTSTVQFVDPGAIDRTYDPRELSRGLISNGTAEIHGAEKTAWLACASFPRVGDTRVVFPASPVGWRVGDRIVVHGSYLRERTHRNPDANGQGFPKTNTEDEVRTITDIAGPVISFATPLVYDHRAPLANLQVYVGNLTRNILYYSENTDYTSNAAMHRHGHVLFMHVRTVNVSWARFQDLGRTNKAIWIDDVMVENADTFIPEAKTKGTGTNVKGRYALHFHRCGVDQLGSPPVMNVGTVVENGPGWGMVNHASYVIMDQCVVYNMPGAGYVEEGGQGTGLFRRCLAVSMRGTGRQDEDIVIPDLGYDGVGFFFRGNNADIEDCVAASCAYAGYKWRNKGFGHGSSNATNRDRLPSSALRHPDMANGRPSIPWEEAPTTRFNRCDAIACETGVYARYWMQPEEGGGPKAFHHDARQEITGMRVWGVSVAGFDLTYSPRVTIRDALVLSEIRTQPQLPYGQKAYVGIAMDINDDDEVYDNVIISGFRTGLSVIKDVNGFPDLRYYLLDNCSIQNCDTPINTNGPSPIIPVARASLDLNRLRFDADPTGPFPDGANIATGISVSGTKWDSIGSTPVTRLYGYLEEKFHFDQMGLTAIIAKGYYSDGAGTYLILPCMITDRITNRVLTTYVRQAFNPAANAGLTIGPNLGGFTPGGRAVWRINCGGAAASGFVGDQGFSGGVQRTTTRTMTADLVTHPGPAAIYQSARTGSLLSYTVGGLTPNALYTVRLHFADFEETKVGRRVFDVVVSGVTMLSHFDVIGLVGAGDIAATQEVMGQADRSGNLRIECIGGKSVNPEALLSGFEIISGLLSSKVPDAVLNPPPGVYASAQTVSIVNSLPFAKLYFTTDGSLPTTASRPFTSPIQITGPTLVRVLATSGTLSSSVVNGFYNVAQGSADGIVNGSFEHPALAPGINAMAFCSNFTGGEVNLPSFPYGWTTPALFWDTDPAIVRGNAADFPAPADGLQLARLKSGASISQVIKPAAGSYKIRLRAGYLRGLSTGRLQYKINGASAGLSVLTSATLTPVESSVFSVASGQSITVELASSAGEICLDAVQLIPATAGATVRLTSPAAGSLPGAPLSVTLTADARSYTGTVSRVEFYQGTTLLGQSTAEVPTYTWNGVTAGTYSLSARVIDSVGQTANSAAVSLTVLPSLPTIALTAPTHHAEFTTSNITLSATGTGVLASVLFLVDGRLVGTDSTAPYNVSWLAGSGLHHIQAVATDTAGQQALSERVVITVNSSSGNTVPTISTIADQSTAHNTQIAGIAFMVGDGESAPAALTLSATSANTALVPLANIMFGGAGSSRTVSVTPASGQSGTATITVTVSDGTLTASESFALQVSAPSAPSAPVITSALTAGGTAHQAFTYAITATQSPTGFQSIGLPAGLSIDVGTGVISGTPTSAGNTPVTIQATNSTGTGSAIVTFAIAAATTSGGGTSGGGTSSSDGGGGCGMGAVAGILMMGLLAVTGLGRSRRRTQRET